MRLYICFVIFTEAIYYWSLVVNDESELLSMQYFIDQLIYKITSSDVGVDQTNSKSLLFDIFFLTGYFIFVITFFCSIVRLCFIYLLITMNAPLNLSPYLSSSYRSLILVFFVSSCFKLNDSERILTNSCQKHSCYHTDLHRDWYRQTICKCNRHSNVDHSG